MICYPYPLLMNAIMQANQSFGIIMMSTEEAGRLGIPESRWVYVHGGAGGADSKDVLQRACYHRSFAMEQSFEQAVAVSGLKRGLAEVDLIDLYSVREDSAAISWDFGAQPHLLSDQCFPIMIKLAASHLKIDSRGRDKPLSLCGGNTFFGGISYAAHGTVAMVRALREGKGKVGLVHGNGEFLTKVRQDPSRPLFDSAQHGI
jgi:hypothetical protein